MRPQAAYEWIRRHPYVPDTALVVVLLAPYLIGGARDTLPVPAAVWLSLGLVVPLIWRRRFPVAVFTVVSLTCLVQLFLTGEWVPLEVGFLVALYTVSAYGVRRWARFGALATGLLGAGLAPLDWNDGPVARPAAVLFMAVLIGALVLCVWTLGDLVRTRRAYVGQLEERARRLEYERDQQALIATAAERARIARELHDVVAHSLSVVVAQADGGSYAARAKPEAAKAALETIGVTARQALTEMRRLLGILRDDGNGADLAPQPGLDQLAQLVARLRDGGLPVQLRVEGEPPARSDPAAGPELAAYRTIQEALTNTLKHGGPSARAEVRLAYDEGGVSLAVTDDGRGAATTGDGSGHGLIGMRERLTVYGGSLDAAPQPGGGFAVRARIPWNGNGASGTVTDEPASARGGDR